MKRVIIAVVVAVVVFAIAASLLIDGPRRPRPEGWKAPWASLPLIKEGEWAVDPLKRGVVQGEFFHATDGLSHCVRKHGGAEGAVVKLELLVETEHGVSHFEYVDAEPRADLPEWLVSCITRTLEEAIPLPTPGLPEGTRWRLELSFLVPPLEELPQVPWWKRWLPRPGPSGGNHVG